MAGARRSMSEAISRKRQQRTNSGVTALGADDLGLSGPL